MEIVVCIKRVASTGSRIVLTEDAQSIETRNLGFTIGPHEECAVEEAVRLIEKHGGSSTVLTLGTEDSIEQLRGSMAVGADQAILLESGGSEWDPMASASAIVEAVQSRQAAGSSFDMLFFGNEAADSGDYQVGIRVAHALGVPCVTGIKSLEVEDGVALAKREADGGWELFKVALPAVFTIKEGINLPRYPSLPGRIRAKKKPIEQLQPAHNPGGPTKIKLMNIEEQASNVEILGKGTEAVAKVLEILKGIGGAA